MDIKVKLDDVELDDVRYLKLTEGIDEIAKAIFTIPTRTLVGTEDIKIEIGGLLDYNDFTEVDPNTHLAIVGTNHLDFDAYKNEDCYLYKDYGTDHFGDFEHKVDMKASALDDYDNSFFWMLSNDINDVHDLYGGGKTFLTLRCIKFSGTSHIVLEEYESGNLWYDDYVITGDTWYYLTVTKSGTSLTCKIYSDSARTILLDTLSLTLHADHKFRYLFGCNTYNDGNANVCTLDIENLTTSITRRFWGNIKSHVETEYNEIEIEAESKEANFKNEDVPYTEIAYTNKTGDWIVKQLVLDFLDWCDTSALVTLDTIPHVHFVDEKILDALTKIAEICDKYWFWEPEDGTIRYVESGDLASGTTINTEYISEENWIEDETEIRNMIHVKGGHKDDNPSNPLVIKIAWDSESEQKYGRREYTYADKEITNEDTAQKLADGLLALHKDPIETGEAYDVPYDEKLKVGRTVPISQTLHDGTYLIKTIEIDYEYETMNIQFSEMPWILSHEIREMQKELAILMRNAIQTYEGGKPILIKKELMKKGSTVSVTETFNSELTVPFNVPGTIGGLSLIKDSIHKRD
jgi:hypothetical protein